MTFYNLCKRPVSLSKQKKETFYTFTMKEDNCLMIEQMSPLFPPPPLFRQNCSKLSDLLTPECGSWQSGDYPALLLVLQCYIGDTFLSWHQDTWQTINTQGDNILTSSYSFIQSWSTKFIAIFHDFKGILKPTVQSRIARLIYRRKIYKGARRRFFLTMTVV